MLGKTVFRALKTAFDYKASQEKDFIPCKDIGLKDIFAVVCNPDP